MRRLKGGIFIYTCKNDKCFKCVFLNPLNIDLLDLLIKDVTHECYSNLINSNVEKNINMAVRRKYLDLLFDSNEAIVGIEVNGFNKKYIYPRNTAFICDCYSNYTLVNKEYSEDKLIIQINFSYGIKDDIPIRKYMIRDKEDKLFVKNFVIYEINMDYCLNFWYNKHIVNDYLFYINKYKYFIMLGLDLDELKELIDITGDERIVKFMNELKKVNENPKFREFITEEQDKEFILNSVRNEGIEQGIGQRNIEIANNMIKDNISVATISKYTGLSINQINSIRC